MKRTVSEEMSDEQRRDELITGLSATGNDAVFINLSHLAQAIGLDKAEGYIESLTQTQEYVNPSLSQKSTLRPKTVCGGLCQVDRKSVLEACLKAKADSTKKAIDAKLQVPKP